MKDKNGMQHDVENGQFTSSGATAAEEKRVNELLGIRDEPSKKGRAKPQEELFGVEYKECKEYKAVEKLLAEKQGHVKDAFFRPEIGGIDLIWGNESAGIAHIIQQREKQGIDGVALVRKIPKIINEGKFIYDEKRDRFNIEHDGNRIVIKPTYDGVKVKWIMTAMEIKKPLEN